MIPMISKLMHLFSGFQTFTDAEPDEKLTADQNLSSSQLKSLLLISQAMSSLNGLDEILSFLLGEMHKVLGIDSAVLLEDQAQVYKVRCHKGFPALFVKDLTVIPGEGELGKTLSLSQNALLTSKEFEKGYGLNGLIKNSNWTSVFASPLSIAFFKFL